MDNKTDLRIRAKSIRKTLDIGILSKNAISKIRQTSTYKSAKNVLIYYPMKFEINILELLNDDKNFYLPKVCDNDLEICPFAIGDVLEKSDFNVFEPCSNSVNADILDLIIVPGLMADSKNYRLGYGGGFYDRFLSKYSQIPTILPIAKELLTDELPVEEFDIRINSIIVC